MLQLRKCSCGMVMLVKPTKSHLAGLAHLRFQEIRDLAADKTLTNRDIAEKIGMTPSRFRQILKALEIERLDRSQKQGRVVEQIEKVPERLREVVSALHSNGYEGKICLAVSGPKSGGGRPMTTRLYVCGRRCVFVRATLRKKAKESDKDFYTFKRPLPIDYEFVIVKCGERWLVIPHGRIRVAAGCVTFGSRKSGVYVLESYEGKWDILDPQKEQVDGNQSEGVVS